jgi:hypothetical protein
MPTKRQFLYPQTSANKVETFLQNAQALEKLQNRKQRSSDPEQNSSEFIVTLFENGRCSIQHITSSATLFLNKSKDE